MGANQSTGKDGDVRIETSESSTTDEDETRSVRAHAIDCCSIASSYQSVSELDDILKQGDSSLNRWSVRSLPVLSELMTNPIYEGDELDAVAEETKEEITTARANPHSDRNATSSAHAADTLATEAETIAPASVRSAIGVTGQATEPSKHLSAATSLSALAGPPDAVYQAADAATVQPATCTTAPSETAAAQVSQVESLPAVAVTQPDCNKTEPVVQGVAHGAAQSHVEGSGPTDISTQLVVSAQEAALMSSVTGQPEAPVGTSDDVMTAPALVSGMKEMAGGLKASPETTLRDGHSDAGRESDRKATIYGSAAIEVEEARTLNLAPKPGLFGAVGLDSDSHSPQGPLAPSDGLSATDTSPPRTQSLADLASHAIADGASTGGDVGLPVDPTPSPSPPPTDATPGVDAITAAPNRRLPSPALSPPVAVAERLCSHDVVDVMADSSELEAIEDGEERDIGPSGDRRDHGCRRMSPSGTSSTAKTLVYAPGVAGSPVPAAAMAWRSSETRNPPLDEVAVGGDSPLLHADSPEVVTAIVASSAGEASGSASEASGTADAVDAAGKGLRVPAEISVATAGAGAGEKTSTMNAMLSLQHANGKVLSHGDNSAAKGKVAMEPLGFGVMGDKVQEQKRAKGQGVAGGDKAQQTKAGGVLSCFACFSVGR